MVRPPPSSAPRCAAASMPRARSGDNGEAGAGQLTGELRRDAQPVARAAARTDHADRIRVGVGPRAAEVEQRRRADDSRERRAGSRESRAARRERRAVPSAAIPNRHRRCEAPWPATRRVFRRCAGFHGVAPRSLAAPRSRSRTAREARPSASARGRARARARGGRESNRACRECRAYRVLEVKSLESDRQRFSGYPMHDISDIADRNWQFARAGQIMPLRQGSPVRSHLGVRQRK